MDTSHDVIPIVGHSWEHCLDSLRERLETPIRTAMDNSVPLEAEGSRLVIGVHGKFSRDFLNRPTCRQEIVSLLPTYDNQTLELEFVALDEPPPKPKGSNGPQGTSGDPRAPRGDPRAQGSQGNPTEAPDGFRWAPVSFPSGQKI